MSYQVSQGPDWIARLLVESPGWIIGVVVAVTAGCLIIAGVSYRRHGIDPQTMREQAEIGIIVICIAASTQLLVGSERLPYVLDVVGGVAIGFGLAHAWIWIYEESDATLVDTNS